jgi:hypothetical protein
VSGREGLCPRGCNSHLRERVGSVQGRRGVRGRGGEGKGGEGEGGKEGVRLYGHSVDAECACADALGLC